MVSFSNRVVVPTQVLVRPLDGESVLLNLETEKYFGLEAMATRMWELLTQLPNIEAAFETLSDEFEVYLNCCARIWGNCWANWSKVVLGDVASVRAI
jgi:hypothetical protein